MNRRGEVSYHFGRAHEMVTTGENCSGYSRCARGAERWLCRLASVSATGMRGTVFLGDILLGRMRTLVLSDNPDAQIQSLEEERARANQALLDSYNLALAEWNAGRKEAKARVGAAWHERRFWKLVAAILRNSRVRRIHPPYQPVLQTGRSQQETVWMAGQQGEDSVFARLSASLDDKWTVVKGFVGHGGEIDFVAVGPLGVVAIEVKFVNGVVHCDGDQWWRDKYDRYGNLCESGLPIADRKGRSPSRQINESSTALAAVIHAPVARVVVLAHERSVYGGFSNFTVNQIARTADLNIAAACGYGSRPLDQAEAAQILRLMEQAYSRWQRWRAKRGSKHASAAAAAPGSARR